MRKLLSLLLSLILILCTVTAAADSEPVIVATYNTILREGPGASDAALSSIPKNAEMTWLGETLKDDQDHDWYKVRFYDTDGYIFGLEARFKDGAESGVSQSIGAYRYGWYAEASSTRPANENEGINVDPACAVDGDLTTAWNSYDEPNGQWLRVSASGNTDYVIAGIRIAGGYWKTDEVYDANTRPWHIDIFCDGRFVTNTTLVDSMDFQTVWFPQSVIGRTIEIRFYDHYAAEENEDIYQGGSGIKDMCITEVELIGELGGTPHEDALDDWGGAVTALRSMMQYNGQLSRGSNGIEVAGLQLLLRDGFGILRGAADGIYGTGTEQAVIALQNKMTQSVTGCEVMRTGVADGAFWRNLMKYMNTL